MPTALKSFGRDRGLQARMLGAMFLLDLVYAVPIGAVLAADVRGISLLLIGGGFFVAQFLAADKLALRAAGARGQRRGGAAAARDDRADLSSRPAEAADPALL